MPIRNTGTTPKPSALDAWQQAWGVTGAKYESYSRLMAATGDTAFTSGTLQLFATPPLTAGDVIGSATFFQSGTAGVTQTHAWVCIVDPGNLNVLAKGTDDTSVWAGTFVTKTLGGLAWTVPTTKAYYLGIVIAATTVPSLRGAAIPGGISNLAPRIAAISTTGLTTPASLGATAAALGQAVGNAFPYFYLT